MRHKSVQIDTVSIGYYCFITVNDMVCCDYFDQVPRSSHYPIIVAPTYLYFRAVTIVDASHRRIRIAKLLRGRGLVRPHMQSVASIVIDVMSGLGISHQRQIASLDSLPVPFTPLTLCVLLPLLVFRPQKGNVTGMFIPLWRVNGTKLPYFY